MKSPFLKLSALGAFLIAFSFQAAAQKDFNVLNFGIKGGVNALKIDNQSFKDGFNYGFLAGAYVHVNTSRSFGFGTELNFAQAVTKPAQDIGTVTGSINLKEMKDVKLEYLGLPVYVNIGNKFKLQAGAQFNIKLNESETVYDQVWHIFSSKDIQGLVGFHWNLPMRLFVNGRYLVGLSDINDVGASERWKSQTIQATVGVRF